MSGGYLAIRRARSFLRNSILGSNEGIQALDGLDLTENPAVRVAVHVRGGDFQQGDSVEQSVFNQVLPIEWYRKQLETLTSSLDLPIEVFLATDGNQAAIADSISLGRTEPHVIGTSSISDLAILANCDVLISSVSSFSMLAAFLSDAPYIWHRDQLGESGGWLSIWGHEALNEGGGPTQNSLRRSIHNPSSFHRGHAHSMKPVWSSALLEYLRHRAMLRVMTTDLIHYGVVASDETQS
ncbi:alpha-1,2-fucosyltransferase [Arthrobacter gyeryongensis]|uniref:alpha-1,2-fucosyltransferase n=1 Tax=Arthrobacter gyeryongensis TaxID=1650592 RepID=UPI003CD0BD24